MQVPRFRFSARHHAPPLVAIAAVVTTLVTGCAGTASDSASAPREEKVYRTGSNLPQREPAPGEVKTIDPSTISRPIRSPGSPTTGSGG